MEDPVQRAIPCHAHPQLHLFLGTPLDFEENKNPNKKPLMGCPHQEKTDLTGARHTLQDCLPAMPVILVQFFTSR